MKILVTGASGFVGSSVCITLRNKYEVFACGRSIPADDLGVQWKLLDISDSRSFRRLFRDIRPDVVIHCAGIAHQTFWKQGLLDYEKVNALYSENLARAAAEVNPNVHFILMSSVSVYGESSKFKKAGVNDICSPTSAYAKSKLSAEDRLSKLVRTGAIKKVDIFRLAPVYDRGWSLNLDKRILSPGRLFYMKFGEGTQKMSAVARANVSNFTGFRLEQVAGESGPALNTFNVCDQNSYGFGEMIEVFRRSIYQPDRGQITIPLDLVWLGTRLAGVMAPKKRAWLHACYDKVAGSLEFENQEMLDVGFKPECTLRSVFGV